MYLLSLKQEVDFFQLIKKRKLNLKEKLVKYIMLKMKKV